jgi:lysophospholipase
MTKPFEGNPLSRDPCRYERTGRLIAARPELGLGDPTIGWIHAAFRAMAPMADPNYPLGLRTPMLIVAGARDRVTLTAAAERFAARLRGGRALVLSQSEHEVLMERDETRAQFWAAFDAFVPGSEGQALRGPAARLEEAEAMGPAA